LRRKASEWGFSESSKKKTGEGGKDKPTSWTKKIEKGSDDADGRRTGKNLSGGELVVCKKPGRDDEDKA